MQVMPNMKVQQCNDDNPENDCGEEAEEKQK